jgi:hypothetical protein
MVTVTTKAVCYAVVTVMSLCSFIYFIVKVIDIGKFFFIDYLTPFSFFFVIGSIIYAGYMTFISLKASGQPILSENLINENNTIWIQDQFFKYLISFGIAHLMLWVILIIAQQFKYFSVFTQWVQFYVNFLLPVLLILDAKYFEHRRCPILMKDVLVFIVTLAIHTVYTLVCYMIQYTNGINFYNFIVSNELNLFVFTFCGYIVYDWILFRKISQEDYFFRN